jgi:hypothetical protein
MDYCTDHNKWVSEVGICPVHADQIFKHGKIIGCEGCRFLRKIKGKYK